MACNAILTNDRDLYILGKYSYPNNTMLIKRTIQKSIENSLFKEKTVIIYGARQVGKTTLVREIMKKYPSAVYFNCDEPDIRSAFENKTSTELRALVGQHALVVVDEAQRVKNIGLTLKLLIDNFPDIQIIATGSSSFELSNRISEPLTGRKIEFHLHPFSLAELVSSSSSLEVNRLLERYLVFGTYPTAVRAGGDTAERLKELARDYAYKDILSHQGIRNPELLERLLQALALQIGNEVSYSEIASLLGTSKQTVEHYVRILEQAFIIFRVGPFSRNLRNELKKLRKIYFYDTGMRNALINNFNMLHLRGDVGALWENFVIAERVKRNNNLGIDANRYFWRTHTGKEIDYIEEMEGKISGYEIKWNKDTFSIPKDFLSAYPGSGVTLINNKNYREFLV